MSSRTAAPQPRGRPTVYVPASGSDSLAQQVLGYITAPFSACLPSTSASAAADERQGLLGRDAESEAYDDSDAISLLSNIADRSRRRARSARRRERWQNGRAAVLGCGLFGRPRGQIANRPITTSDGEHQQDDDENGDAQLRRARALSVDSATSGDGTTESLGVGQESGDEDAGMLADADIAEISQSNEEVEETQRKAQEEQAAAEEAARVAAESQEARRKEERERLAADAARVEAEQLAKQQAEEAALAAEEEAAIAKARRRAERKAVKEGLLAARAQGQRGSGRRLTEAEAEAAAGGFDFAEEQEQMPPDGRAYDGYEQEEAVYREGDEYGQYEDGQLQHPSQQQEVIHHHHYYHEPQQEQHDAYQPAQYQQPGFAPFNIPSIVDPSPPEEAVDDEEEDEDDADIAGLAFGKSRKKRLDRNAGSGSRSNGSGSGSWQSGSARNERRYERMGGGGSNSSAGARRESAATDGGSSNGGASSDKRSYRDRPRRHERTGSRSTGSGAGRALREGPSSAKIIPSPTIPEADSSRDLSIQTVRPTDAEADNRADAAAGGFDDYLSPPPSSAGGGREWRTDEPALDKIGSPTADAIRRGSFATPPSSTSARSGRRREAPRKAAVEHSGGGGLNAPRNPQGANPFARGGFNDEADGL